MAGKLKKDLTGKKFGKLTVLKRANNHKIYIMWYCECECGNKKEIYSTHLLRGNIKRCGCLYQITPNNFTVCGEFTGSHFAEIKGLATKSKRKNRQNLDYELDPKFLWELFLKQER